MFVVTGGAGFIGSNLVRGLNRRGITDVLVVDDLANGEKHPGLNALEFADLVDFRDYVERPGDFGQTEAVFHQGACSDTMETDERYVMSVNYEFSKRLLDFCLGRCPFVYASSASVYGDGKRGFREEPACEWPLNLYAFSKFLFDRWVRRVLPQASTQVVGLRYFNVYGPQENHKGRMASVVFKFHGQAREEGKLLVFEGSEDFRRDFVWVEDAVDVNLFFLDHPEQSGVFNCGTGRAESFLALAECAARHYEGAVIETIPFPEALRGKYQDFTQADLVRLREAGYEREFTSLEDGVAAYVRVLQETGGYHREPPGSRGS
ncbi:MAG: ADP-glyceromanno-heptose 6-epimerase [Planctomycetota bacterium]|nr:ADP-glyceromanno-heptose 6-epimerase [Planctomycetota bacterium]